MDVFTIFPLIIRLLILVIANIDIHKHLMKKYNKILFRLITKIFTGLLGIVVASISSHIKCRSLST